MSKTFTWQEVAKHNTEQSCYVAIDKKVYDITAFLEKHPGGKEYLLLAAGSSSRHLFNLWPVFNIIPRQRLYRFISFLS